MRIRDIVVRDRDHVDRGERAESRGEAVRHGAVDGAAARRKPQPGRCRTRGADHAGWPCHGFDRRQRPPARHRRRLESNASAPPACPRVLGIAAVAPGHAGARPARRRDKLRIRASGLLAGLDWLDSLSLTGLDGQNLNEIGLKNGSLIVDDQQRGNKWNFENITLSLRRPSGGGVALSVGEEGSHAWSLRVAVGPPANGVRSVDIRADKVSTKNILLALRMKDLTYSADLPLTGELKGELGRDGLPTYFRGKITAGAGTIIDSDTPDYPMAIDQAEMNVEWDSGRRVLVAPFKIISGQNRITLLAHLEPPNDSIPDWQLGFSGGTIVLAGIDERAAADLQPHRHRPALRHRKAPRAADPGRYQQRRDRRRRNRQHRLFRRSRA